MNCPYTSKAGVALNSILEAHIVECAVEAERGRAARVAEHSWRVHDGVAVRVYDRTAPRLADAVSFGLDVEQIVRTGLENPELTPDYS